MLVWSHQAWVKLSLASSFPSIMGNGMCQECVLLIFNLSRHGTRVSKCYVYVVPDWQDSRTVCGKLVCRCFVGPALCTLGHFDRPRDALYDQDHASMVTEQLFALFIIFSVMVCVFWPVLPLTLHGLLVKRWWNVCVDLPWVHFARWYNFGWVSGAIPQSCDLLEPASSFKAWQRLHNLNAFEAFVYSMFSGTCCIARCNLGHRCHFPPWIQYIDWRLSRSEKSQNVRVFTDRSRVSWMKCK